MSTVPLSLAIPTIGRPELLHRLLESIARCQPQPQEVLVLDQSGGSAVAEVAAVFPLLQIRVVPASERGEAKARNGCLAHASHDLLLWVDDDCTVAEDWVARAWGRARAEPTTLITGRVLPGEAGRIVPSIRTDTVAQDYTGRLSCSALHPGNMLLHRPSALALGGFDERLPSAVDNDFCYRWLRSGRRLLYDPTLVVWHHDWRSPRELHALHLAYGHGQGMLYAKHLRQGDLGMLRFLVSDCYQYIRSLALAVGRRRPAWTDWRRRIPRGVLSGLVEGWRVFRE